MPMRIADCAVDLSNSEQHLSNLELQITDSDSGPDSPEKSCTAGLSQMLELKGS